LYQHVADHLIASGEQVNGTLVAAKLIISRMIGEELMIGTFQELAHVLGRECWVGSGHLK